MSLSDIPIDIVKAFILPYLSGVERSRLFSTCTRYYHIYDQFDRIKSIRYDWLLRSKKNTSSSRCGKCQISMKPHKIETHNCTPLLKIELADIRICSFCDQPIHKNRMVTHVKKCTIGKLKEGKCTKFCGKTGYMRDIRPQYCHKGNRFLDGNKNVVPMKCITCDKITTNYTSGCTNCKIIQCTPSICEICRSIIGDDCSKSYKHMCKPGYYNRTYVNCSDMLEQWHQYLMRNQQVMINLVDDKYVFVRIVHSIDSVIRINSLTLWDGIGFCNMYCIEPDEIDDVFIAQIKQDAYVRAFVVIRGPTNDPKVIICTKGFLNPHDANAKQWIKLN